ncbi:MAG TPA: hypothetical protein GXX23_06830 [Firmicutes bacterium]|nr:hypothetical protein [Candidatus Fermentithermobacillaceae bacterium]
MFWAVLVVILKALGWTLGVLAFVGLLALALPVRIRLTGEAGVTGLDELPDVFLLDSDFGSDAVAVRSGSAADTVSSDSGPVISVSGQGRLYVSVLGGALAFDANTDKDVQLCALGIRLRSWNVGMSAKRDAGGRASVKRGAPDDQDANGERPVGGGNDGRHRNAVREDRRDSEGESGQGRSRRRGRVTVSLGKAAREVRKHLAPNVRKRTLAFVREVWRLLDVSLDVDVEYGFDDPGYTGMLYAAYVSIRNALGLQGLRLRPDFTKEMIEARGDLDVRFSPMSIMWSFGRFAFSREIRPLWWKRRLGFSHAKNNA